MQRCLQLAAMGAGHVAPNPMVGAVLVHNNRIIGEGYHRQYGEAHAEVNCIESVSSHDKQFVAESTMYVSLEPCAHFGKTPPCVDLIIKKKIPRVVIGCRDRFEKVNGKGIEKLEAAGVDVVTGVLENECLDLNKRFFTFHEKRRPYIILKWAKSSDSKIASENSSRVIISNDFSNHLVHQWRSEEAAILVGTNTALMDDPALTTRLWPGKNPVRLVIDRTLKLPSTLKLFDKTVRTIVFNETKQQDEGMLVYQLLNKKEDALAQIMSALYSLEIQSVLVEGGTKLLQSFIDAGLWDEARVITNAEMTIGNGLDSPILKNDALLKEQKFKNDIVSFYKQDILKK